MELPHVGAHHEETGVQILPGGRGAWEGGPLAEHGVAEAVFGEFHGQRGAIDDVADDLDTVGGTAVVRVLPTNEVDEVRHIRRRSAKVGLQVARECGIPGIETHQRIGRA